MKKKLGYAIICLLLTSAVFADYINEADNEPNLKIKEININFIKS
jgi:hypothetical protein